MISGWCRCCPRKRPLTFDAWVIGWMRHCLRSKLPFARLLVNKKPPISRGLAEFLQNELGCLELEADVDTDVALVPVVGSPCSGATIAAISDEEAELISGPDYDT